MCVSIYIERELGKYRYKMDEMMKKIPTHVGPYRFVNHLGSGSFAQVYRAVHDNNGEQVAVKAILGKKLNSKLRENLECEIRILKDFKHPNIVGLHGIDKTSSRGEFIFLVTALKVSVNG